MKNARSDRTASAWAGAVLIVAALALAPAPAVVADPGPESLEPVPLFHALERLWEGLASPFELLFDAVTAGSESDPTGATTSSDDGDLETSILHGPRIDPDG